MTKYLNIPIHVGNYWNNRMNLDNLRIRFIKNILLQLIVANHSSVVTINVMKIIEKNNNIDHE